MLRATRVALAVAVLCAAASSAAASATGATPSPRGVLTATEYAQLDEQHVALRKFEHNKLATWNEGYAACDKVGQSTDLLRSERTNCNQAVGIDQSLEGFYAKAERCAALQTTTTTTTPATTTTTAATTTGATTTSTTTTTTGGLDSAQWQLIACLEPGYAVISRAAKAVYEARNRIARPGSRPAFRADAACSPWPPVIPTSSS